MVRWAALLAILTVTRPGDAGPAHGWGDGGDTPLVVVAARTRGPVGGRQGTAPRSPHPLAERTVRTAADEAEAFGHGGMIRGKRANHYVALTFDDGPHRTRTPMVLDTLDRHGVPATFFVVGHRLAGKSERADERRQIATDIVRRGHDLGNHTYRHSNLRALSARQARREIERGERYIRRVLGHRSYLFRAPYGAWAASGYLRARGYTRVGWTFDVRDFWDRGDLATRLLDQIERHQGGITVLHDTHEGTARSLSKLLSQLEVRNCARLERGLRPIVPVSLHYFMTTAEGRPRPLPAHAIRREASYLRRLAASCRRFDKQPQGH